MTQEEKEFGLKIRKKIGINNYLFSDNYLNTHEGLDKLITDSDKDKTLMDLIHRLQSSTVTFIKECTIENICYLYSELGRITHEYMHILHDELCDKFKDAKRELSVQYRTMMFINNMVNSIANDLFDKNELALTIDYIKSGLINGDDK